ncbi:MAG: hypothetical protein M1536_01800 [Firmicutes bacterium]|nr:hypothetical protein [Bacillota bacterium]
MNLEERLLKLERENRRLRKYFFVLALLVLAPLFASPIWIANATNSPKSINVDEITTKNLSIVNQEGKVVATLTADDKGGSLAVFNNQGKAGADLFVTDNGGILGIYNNQDKRVVALVAGDKGGGLGIANNQEEVMAGLAVFDDGCNLTIFNNKKAVAKLSATDGFPTLKLSDKNGFFSIIGSTDLVKPQTGETKKTSAASITLFDNEKNVIWQAPSQESSEDAIKQIASEYFRLIQNDNFDDAAKLFHYPPEYTKQELANDLRAVSSVLKLFKQEFGQIQAAKISSNPDLYYSIGEEGGNVPYWQKHPTSYELTFEVNFEKEGPGYIVIDFCNINNKLEIRIVNYGLPASRPDSKNRIMDVEQKIMKMKKEK